MENNKRNKISITLLAVLLIQIAAPIINDFSKEENMNPFFLEEDNKESENNLLPSLADSYSPDANGYIRNWLRVGIFEEGTAWDNYPTINGSQVLPANDTIYYIDGDYVQSNNNSVIKNIKEYFELYSKTHQGVCTIIIESFSTFILIGISCANKPFQIRIARDNIKNDFI